jgi:hypothetical protein
MEPETAVEAAAAVEDTASSGRWMRFSSITGRV